MAEIAEGGATPVETPAWLVRFEDARRALDAIEAAVKAARKALTGLENPASEPQAVLSAMECLSAVQDCVKAPGLESSAVAEVVEGARQAVVEQQFRGLRLLQQAAEAAGLSFERLTEAEVRLGQATVKLDLDRGEAEVRYAREPLTSLRFDPPKIVKAVQEGLAALTPVGTPEQLFDELTSAYRAAVARQKLSMGDRVALVELLPELFVLRQTKGFFEAPLTKKPVPVTRAHLAFTLDLLQRARKLEHQGVRLDLGTATSGATADKKKVIFLQTAAAGGQYYFSLALKRASRESADAV